MARYAKATIKCQQCGEQFEAKRSTARFCPRCRVIRATEKYHLYEKRHPGECSQCGKPITRRAKLCRSCENKTRNSKYLGKNNPNWKGGRTHNEGYVYILHPREGKKHRYQAEHIVVWEQSNNKPLPKGWVVHHYNGIRDDNLPENLFGMPRKQHSLKQAFEPYEKRIQELEDELRKLK